MLQWSDILSQVKSLEDVSINATLLDDLERRFRYLNAIQASRIHFYTPTFKSYASSEFVSCGKNTWPAISITGGECKLQCDHCKAKILEPMIPARSPDELWRVVNAQIEAGALGMLITGGSNHQNEVEYGLYYPILRRIKDVFPQFKIAMHTALVNPDRARCMEESGVDVAMMDVIGSQDTISQVYHLRRSVEDFERSLACLVGTRMKIVPHIVVGLHYGKLLGEWQALEVVKRHLPSALVLVVVMPFYAPPQRPFSTPKSVEVGGFFMDVREQLPEIPVLLGCARPPGRTKMEIDTYAVFAGLNGIAHPADGMVELALRLGREVQVSPVCCSMAVGEEIMATSMDQPALKLDEEFLLARESARERVSKNQTGLDAIKVVATTGGCCG